MEEEARKLSEEMHAEADRCAVEFRRTGSQYNDGRADALYEFGDRVDELELQLATAQQDALELAAWRVIAAWLWKNPGPVLWLCEKMRLHVSRSHRELHEASVAEVLADALAPGWREL